MTEAERRLRLAERGLPWAEVGRRRGVSAMVAWRSVKRWLFPEEWEGLRQRRRALRASVRKG